MAQPETTLALFVGESFAEACLKTADAPIQFHRWYLGKEGLRGGLQRFLQQASVEKINSAIVGSRFLEKIFSYRLGGSVATVTTAGFETWTTLRQPIALRPSSLSSSELIFAAEERCTSEGIIEKELSDESVQTLVEGLRTKQAKRVCIHFLNADKNPQNQNKLQHALLAENFEVFIPESPARAEITANAEMKMDEVSRWRKNILNASVSGTFEEIQGEINLALAPYLPEGQLPQFIAADGKTFDVQTEQRLSSLWGPSFGWTEGLRNSVSGQFDVLYLGLDQFSIFYPGKTSPVWDSPWGRVAMPHVKTVLLSLQPTSAIAVNSWGALDFAGALGYEPGPMFMGRGQAPTLLDLWAEDLNGITALEERRSAPGMQKFKNQMWALNKSSSVPMESEEKVQPSLRELALQKLVLNILMTTENKKVLCMGTLAPLFFKELKKRMPQLSLELRPELETTSLFYSAKPEQNHAL